MRFYDFSRCLLYGFWLPSDPRTVVDFFKSRRSVGHRKWACTGGESWAGDYIYCNNWSLADSADNQKRFLRPVVVVSDEGEWARRICDYQRQYFDSSSGLWLALLYLYVSGLELAALVSLLALLFIWGKKNE